MSISIKIATLAMVCLIGISAQTQDDQFTLVREDDSIYVYERWIIFPDSDPPQNAREVRVNFI